MDTSNTIQIISIIATFIVSITAIGISIATLMQNNRAIIGASRANIVFYIDTPLGGNEKEQ